MKSPLIEEMQLDFKQKLFNVINSNRKKLKVIMNNNSRCEEEACTLKCSKSFKTIIIFDWDDTLLCTTSLIPEGCNYQCCASCTVKDTLDKLEDAVFKILYESLKHGKVYIITNSTDGWVEYSTFKFIPKVSKLLDKITIISARSNYEGEFPLNSNEWKVHAFMDTIKDVDTNSVTNLIAIGDSNGEIEASKQLLKSFPNAYLKTIKFRELPTPIELVKQISIITERLENIFSSDKNLTIRLERKQKENNEKVQI